MAMKFRCECGKVLRTDKRNAGKKTRCPACQRTVLVPTPASPGGAEPGAETRDDVRAETKPCPNCGAQLAEGAILCTGCGCRLEDGATFHGAAATPMAPIAASGPAARRQTRPLVSFLTGALKLAVVLALVGGGYRAYKAIYGWYVCEKAQAEGSRIVRELLANRRTPADRRGNVEEKEKNAAVELSRLLPTAPHFFGKLCADYEKGSDVDVPLHQVIRNLPTDMDALSLFEVPKKLPLSFQAAVEHVHTNKKFEWVLEQSCHANPDFRVFAAEALKLTFPYKKLDDKRLSRLAQSVSEEDKKLLYDEVYDEVHGPLAEKLAGDYCLSLKLLWEQAPGQYAIVKPEGARVAGDSEGEWRGGVSFQSFSHVRRETVCEDLTRIVELVFRFKPMIEFHIPAPCVKARTKDRNWTFEMLGETKTVHASELGEFCMECPVRQSGDFFRALGAFHCGKIHRGTVSLKCPDGEPVLAIEGIPRYAVRYEKTSRGEQELVKYRPGYFKFETILTERQKRVPLDQNK